MCSDIHINGYNVLKNVTPSTIVVPISTRGIGFHTQMLFSRAVAVVDVDVPSSVFSLYRVSLFQLHYRMTRVRNSKPLFYDNHFCSQPLGHRFSEVISQNNRNFVTLARLISAVGNFTLDDIEYTPRFPLLPESKFPDPTNVHALNLRDVVVSLSNERTDVQVRKYFYDNNPLPCAKWNSPNDSSFPLLTNPEDIMPDNYDEDNLRDDVTLVESLMGGFQVSLSVDSVLYDGSGDPSILVSNRPGGLRIGEVPVDNGQPSFEMTSLQGNISTFWCSRSLNPNQLALGSLYLVGELPEPKSFDMNYALRSPTIQVLQANVNLRTLITRGAL